MNVVRLSEPSLELRSLRDSDLRHHTRLAYCGDCQTPLMVGESIAVVDNVIYCRACGIVRHTRLIGGQ